MAERLMGCHKVCYPSQREAEAGMQDLIERAKRTGTGGTSYKRLSVYYCLACRAWHIGRANKLPKNFKAAAPAPKLPTRGELLRKLRKMQKEWQRHEDRRLRWRAEMLGKIIERDLADLCIEREIRQRVREIEAQLLK